MTLFRKLFTHALFISKYLLCHLGFWMDFDILIQKHALCVVAMKNSPSKSLYKIIPFQQNKMHKVPLRGNLGVGL